MHAVRWPWATCPDAGRPLQALVGMELSDRCTAVAEVTDPRMNCTHQFDLAGLCVTHAARGTETRQYDVELPPPDDVDGDAAPVARRRARRSSGRSRSARRARGRWSARAAVRRGAVARRVHEVGRRDVPARGRRGRDRAAARRATSAWAGAWTSRRSRSRSELAGIMSGVCYSMQPAVMPVAFRNEGSHPRLRRATADALLDGAATTLLPSGASEPTRSA